ncbi:hypothetical protein CHS0354_027218 [Potamilus streckersoni]|uniref:Integrase core domain-containing protein n=1 Tax=Potamilus streckersoni TaxID=2493646 RepID=A0AAE0SZR5_9BIVA|nr:hypothetical protein CHS0354_027218 [Potamilus streckersoni]
MHGYRWMYQKCLSNGLKVKKEEIRLMLEILDPQGVELRQRRCLRRRQYFSKGPNYCWHIDSNDKLKSYGLCINGCTDGYSRKLIWLKVGRSNSDPKVIAKYFLAAVEEYGGCPTFMRGDMATENVRIPTMQTFIRPSDGLDVENDRTFIYCKSTLNTRIESWWEILRKECC